MADAGPFGPHHERRAARRSSGLGPGGPSDLPFTASFSRAPAENFTTFEAAIVIASPVRKLRPWRSPRSCTSKPPKPGNLTGSPFPIASATAPQNASTARPASVFRHAALVGHEGDELFLGQSRISMRSDPHDAYQPLDEGFDR
jgi:hypothetical protein